jgi:hypothetical protein
MPEPPRSRRARDVAETALVRLVSGYGETPEFVLLGGLVPDLLCGNAVRQHVGTTDVDVQIDLEIQGGSTNAPRLERALRECGFIPSHDHAWRWQDETIAGVVVKIEFLADLDSAPGQATLNFDGCTSLGAVNLRGTGFAARDWQLRSFDAVSNGRPTTVEVRVATLPAYLLAKTHAAYGRGIAKDWYDIAYVVLHNDDGGPDAAAERVRTTFASDLIGQTRTAVDELAANFIDDGAQGSIAYSQTMVSLYPDLDPDVLANDAVAGIAAFVAGLDISP